MAVTRSKSTKSAPLPTQSARTTSAGPARPRAASSASAKSAKPGSSIAANAADSRSAKKRKAPPTDTAAVVKRRDARRSSDANSTSPMGHSTGRESARVTKPRASATTSLAARSTRSSTNSATPERPREPNYPQVFWRTDRNPTPPVPAEDMPSEDGPERVAYVLRLAAAINTINAQEKLASPATVVEDSMPWKSHTVQLEFPERHTRSTPFPPRKETR